MASPANDHQQPFPTTISAPPPTPSTTTTQPPTSDSSSDLLSRLLHRLPPSLSTNTNTPLLLRRRSSLSTTVSPPSIPFSDLTTTLPSTINQLPFFQLTHHSIPPELARSAESDSASLFNLSTHQKNQHFPLTWPLGFDDDDEDDVTAGDSLFLDSLSLDSACSSTESPELRLSSLCELTRQMEKLGVAVVDALTCAVGLRNPGVVSGLMWVSRISGDKAGGSGRFYPYVVGLHYQSRSQKCSVLTDTGLVSVSTEMDSVLVTLGDIAQVWSNGKLKKVRGKPMLIMEEGNETPSVSMSLLVTLPLESTVSPLLPRAGISVRGGTDHHEDQNEDVNDGEEDMFNSFSFEDYAWRVYHERVPLKDPLDRYRNKL